jgi:predicted transglutaminase-like cysteine proteinase
VHDAFLIVGRKAPPLPGLPGGSLARLPRLLAHAWLALLLALVPGHGTLAWDTTRMASAARKAGGGAVAGVQALQALMGEALAVDEPARLQMVNQFFNRRILFRDDMEVWGQLDYWASPVETLAQGAGDCEDYAIAKYFTLVSAGVPSSRLRLVYVRAQLGGPQGVVQAHMVLAYYPTADAEPLILDNLISEVRPASRRPDLVPVFSFNGEGLWQGVGGQVAGDPVARLSRWREVLAKARAEGFQ